MKNFLKGSLFFAVLNLAYVGTTYSQDNNYDEINEEVQRENREQANAALAKFVDMTNLKEMTATNIPKRVKLKGLDKEYKPFLKCATKFAKKKKGGTEGAKILAKITENLFDGDTLTTDSYTIKTVAKECQKAYRKLDSAKKVYINAGTLSDNSAINKFLASVYSKRVRVCQARSVSVLAGALFVGRAGINTMKCLYDNGKVKNFAGVIAGIGLGAGGMVSVSRKVYEAGTVNRVSAVNVLMDSDFDMDYALGVVSNLPEGSQMAYYGHQGYNYDRRENVNVGLGVSAQSVAGGLGIQVWPSSTRWGYLLGLLK